MTTIEALTYSDHYRPYGDGYAPQIVLTASHGRLDDITELNTISLPFTGEQFSEWREALADKYRYSNPEKYGQDGDILARFMKIFFDLEMIHTGTSGHSQGDWGESFVFGTPEFYATTGATGIQESDHNDLCAWIWGDVYEVTEVVSPEVSTTETCNLGHNHTTIIEYEETTMSIIYGMDQAMKFAQEHNIEIEGL